MTAAVYPVAPAVLPLQIAAQKLWRIRWLMREHALDPLAADVHLRGLRDHPNPRVAALAGHTTGLAFQILDLRSSA
ncbi:hypothetical protein [Reyranella sp.]|uniref:hypothetical protein n=1 Tax=Reyranella sp. TaxID=1929291 RepID=UPI003D140F25